MVLSISLLSSESIEQSTVALPSLEGFYILNKANE